MIEKVLRDKIENLIARAPGIANVSIMERTIEWQADGEAWITEAVNAVAIAVPDLLNTYRRRMLELTVVPQPLPECVPRIASLLRSLLTDIDAGLVATLVASASAWHKTRRALRFRLLP